MIDIDVISREIANQEGVRQAKVQVFIESDSGKMIETTYSVKFYSDDDYHWSISTNPLN